MSGLFPHIRDAQQNSPPLYFNSPKTHPFLPSFHIYSKHNLYPRSISMSELYSDIDCDVQQNF